MYYRVVANTVQIITIHDTRKNPESLKMLGWVEKVPFETGLKETVDWYKNYALPNNYWI